MEPSALDASIEQAMADFRRAREQAREIAERMNALSVTMSSPRNEISVTVGATGNLKGIEFHGTAFRGMAGAELSALIMAASAKATAAASQQLAKLGVPSVSDALSKIPENPTADDFLNLTGMNRLKRGQ
jgi:DNA-binding protein YbaB